MAEKKKAKDLDPKAKGAQVKGGKNDSILSNDGRRAFLRRTVKRAAGGPDGVIRPKN
jgi:hypothetical protein